MPLNKDILGDALYNCSKEWNDKTPDELGDMEQARKAFWTAMAEVVINHFKTSASIPGTGLVAPKYAVTHVAKNL